MLKYISTDCEKDKLFMKMQVLICNSILASIGKIIQSNPIPLREFSLNYHLSDANHLKYLTSKQKDFSNKRIL